MRNLKALLKELPKLTFVNLLKALFAITVVATIGWLGGIFHVYQTIWTYLKILLQSQTPLWATISLLALSSLWLYLITSHKKTFRKSSGGTDLFSAMGVKWLVSYQHKSIIHFDENPFCPHHKTRMVGIRDSFVCPQDNCNFKISRQDLAFALTPAKNIVEALILEK
ncbi:MAG: hypothetical protein OEY01_07090 [Desulfobulbaceae bacterium]|nr:hypothetical protein [Desulfobulbaceae bacterium]HIJ78821.1 hypothetical protein [Deltaproteobacteria bacterium]